MSAAQRHIDAFLEMLDVEPGAAANTIEAYPVDEASPSYRFMGFRDMFAARGFHEIGMAGSRRHVMRLEH